MIQKKPPHCPRPRKYAHIRIDNFGIKENNVMGVEDANSCPLNLISEYEYNLSKNDLGSTLEKIKPDSRDSYRNKSHRCFCKSCRYP